MIDSNLEIRASRDVYDPYNESVRFYLRTIDRQNNRIGIARPLIFESMPLDKIGGQLVEPTFRLEDEQAQKLIDALWNCGLRPREGTGSAGSLAATQRHLNDMQKIVFKDFP